MQSARKVNSCQSLCISHRPSRLITTIITVEMLSEAVKILKGEYALRAIKVHNMDKAIVFCRTKVDCDNMENFLNKAGGGTVLSLCL